jgi:hypothetical protein
MKIASYLSPLFLAITFFANAQDASPANPEIEKIDARLKELTLIWQQDTAIINRLTNNKRTPVSEGSREYLMCLESSKRIQLAEAEAKTLKAKKEELIAQGTGAGSKDVSHLDLEASKKVSLDGIVDVAWEGGNVLSNGVLRLSKTSPLDSLPESNVTYSREKYGLKIKQLFVGMPYSQAKEPLKELALKVKQSPPTKGIYAADGKERFIARECNKMEDKDSFEIQYSLLNKTSLNKGEDHNKNTIVKLHVGSDGIISEIYFHAICFNVGESSLAQFVEAFSENYEVELESSTKSSQDYGIDSVSITYENLSTSGHKVEISHILATEYSTEVEWGKTTLNGSLGVRLSRSVSAEALKKEFE